MYIAIRGKEFCSGGGDILAWPKNDPGPSTLDSYLKERPIEYPACAGVHTTNRAIVLARELDLPFLLPAAFWLAATRLDYLTKDYTNTISSSDRGAILSVVNPLRIAYTKYLFGWLDGNSLDCTTGQECNAKKEKYALEVWKPPGIFLVFT
ncbi:hypothetical protein DFH07DRAFT_770646 [Mycena maculata]|uniref:Uncharacterized protein n=1 Tax=Mycena maculata TaxID=230809 RepID=A0AAD7JJR9_9AGAR|nr:hypothetical protein DFH07DRAFT_770646 [Mycena maculata]